MRSTVQLLEEILNNFFRENGSQAIAQQIFGCVDYELELGLGNQKFSDPVNLRVSLHDLNLYFRAFPPAEEDVSPFTLDWQIKADNRASRLNLIASFERVSAWQLVHAKNLLFKPGQAAVNNSKQSATKINPALKRPTKHSKRKDKKQG